MTRWPCGIGYLVAPCVCPHSVVGWGLQAANYLNIQSLLDLTTQTVAELIKGKTPEQIRAEFGIVNDFTPEEEEEIKRDNAWSEDR